MKLFIDTANLEEIKAAESLGVLDGVTTNPTLLSKEKTEPRTQLERICKIVEGPVSAEVTGLTPDAMIEEALELAKISGNIVIKVPCTVEGLKVTRLLSNKGIKTNLTLCFSPSQALLTARAGATYVSPFVGRLDDISAQGMDLIADIRSIYDNYGLGTQIIAASIRHPMHFVNSARIGVDVATVPFSVISMLMKHPLTDIGLARFADDWKKLHDSLV